MISMKKKIDLPDVTLICLTNQKFKEHKVAIDKSCEGINFGGVKLIWDEKCDNINEWNRKIVYDLWKYVDTSHALLIHHDGYVINPRKWDPEWLKLDYIGAPWPLPTDDYSYRDMDGRIIRVGNSVSLRSKELMMAPSFHSFEWKPYYGNTNEDGFICVHHRVALEAMGMKFATFEQALPFSKEAELPENKNLKTFAFHTHG